MNAEDARDGRATQHLQVRRYFDDLFAGQPVLGILRGFPPEETLARAERAWDLGVTAIEVPIEVPEALPSLAATVAAARERGLTVGAGTICTVEQVRAAVQVGASFTVAPGFDSVIAAESASAGLPHLPGVSTPSEIQQAMRAGHVWLKVFPASVLGANWIQAIRGPFPQLRLVATGGLDSSNARAFLAAGADVVAMGSALADPLQIDRLAELITSAATG
jgi:2-dehydro-3-deoxyphosphogluconate aldolase/(4S)-4-hydroxy-2-oxoglutarate aldolase